jgi:hypothetical protein
MQDCRNLELYWNNVLAAESSRKAVFHVKKVKGSWIYVAFWVYFCIWIGDNIHYLNYSPSVNDSVKIMYKVGICNPRTLESEGGGLWVPGQPGLYDLKKRKKVVIWIQDIHIVDYYMRVKVFHKTLDWMCTTVLNLLQYIIHTECVYRLTLRWSCSLNSLCVIFI